MKTFQFIKLFILVFSLNPVSNLSIGPNFIPVEHTPYNLKLEPRTPEGNKKYSFVSADGIESRDSFREPELLIADRVNPEKDDDILVFQPGFGFLGIMADRAPKGKTFLASQSDRERQLSELNMEKNGIENVENGLFSFPSEIDRKFDLVLYAPREYDPVDLIKYQISELAELLKKNGKLYVAGRKKGGINRYRNYMREMDGETEKLGQRNGHRLYSFSPAGDINPEKPRIEKEFSAEIEGTEADFTTFKGLFSAGRIDPGTELLIKNVEMSGDEKMLDVGCGYGAIGIFLSKLHSCELYLSDDSSLAVHYAEKNLEANDVENYRVENSDCLDGFENQKFDKIVANPPTHQGKDITDEIIEKSFQRLKNGGELYLVFQQEVGLDQRMREIFGNSETVAEEKGYRVSRSVKRSA